MTRKRTRLSQKKSEQATATKKESTSSEQELTPASLHQARKEAGTDFSLEDYPNFQKLRKIAWELEKDDFPEDLSQLGLGFFHAIGSEKKLRSAQASYVCDEGEEIEIERYVGKDVYSYRQAAQEDQDDSPFSEAMRMEVAGELIEMSLDPNLEKSWQREIAEVIENNFPEKKVSQLESSLKSRFGREVESGNKD